MKRVLLGFAVLLFFSSCASQASPRVMNPSGTASPLPWKADPSQVLENQTVRKTGEASFHWIHLTGAEKPHTHDTHDIMVIVVQGEADVHFQGRTVHAKTGDVVEIPRGAMHWAENTTPGGAVAYAVFTPPFDGKDYHQVD